MDSSFLQDLSPLERFFTTEEGATSEPQNADKTKALQLFLKVWEHAPSEWKEQCKVPEAIKKRHRLDVDSWSQGFITVPKFVLTHLQAWNNNPSSFLTSGEGWSFDQSENAFTRLFRFMDYSEGEETVIRNIRFRFSQMCMHDLMTRLDCSKLRLNSKAEDEFARRVQVKGDRRQIREKVKKWAAVGGKYVSLSKDLGGLGAIIRIPADISTAKLERIPASGKRREQIIAYLKRRGIRDVKQKDTNLCYEVAPKIWQALRADANSDFLEHAPVAQNEQLPKTRKRKNKTNHSSKKIVRCASIPLEETTHHCSDTSATMEPVVDHAIASDECHGAIQSTTAPTHIFGSQASNGLAVLAQTCPRIPSLWTAQPADNVSVPDDSHLENIALPPLDFTQTSNQGGDKDFWEHMVTVTPPYNLWNDVHPTSDFWAEMIEVPFQA